MNQPQPPQTLREHFLAPFGFVLVWECWPHWANVTAYEVVSREVAPDPERIEFALAGSNSSNDLTDDLAKARPYLSGFIKFDGCAELDQGCEHWCGADGFEAHIRLLHHIYCKAGELMGDAFLPPLAAISLPPDRK